MFRAGVAGLWFAFLTSTLVALPACAPTAKIGLGNELTSNEDPTLVCSIWPAGTVCPGDPIGLKICPNAPEQLVWADGRTERLPPDYFGGWEIVSSEADIPSCPDGSRPRPQDMTPYRSGEPTG